MLPWRMWVFESVLSIPDSVGVFRQFCDTIGCMVREMAPFLRFSEFVKPFHPIFADTQNHEIRNVFFGHINDSDLYHGRLKRRNAAEI